MPIAVEIVYETQHQKEAGYIDRWSGARIERRSHPSCPARISLVFNPLI
jgi:hypothetical protein